jgi:hypothetical protein
MTGPLAATGMHAPPTNPAPPLIRASARLPDVPGTTDALITGQLDKFIGAWSAANRH